MEMGADNKDLRGKFIT